MQHQESADAGDCLSAVAGMAAFVREGAELAGRYTAVFRDADGNILHEEEFDNLVTTAGRNFALDTVLAGVAYTVVGPFIGLISSVSFSAVALTDTMPSHAGWLESGGANAPTMSSTRLTAAWLAAAAASKSLSAPLVFTFTGAGTVQGVFLALGAGAVNTVGSAAGTLYSAGLLATPQPVIGGNTLAISYAGTM